VAEAETHQRLPGWERSEFTAAGYTRDVYRRGRGPGVIIVHEIPGITPNVLRFANEVVDAGFTVLLPSLVGTPGRAPTAGYVLETVAKVCVSQEFSNWALHRTSPIINYLRALARKLHAELGGPGVGALGMCFSGGFALAMMVDDSVVAPVLSQPSMPFAVTKARGADLNLSPEDTQAVVRRASAGCEVLGLRFTEDMAVGTRFDSLRKLLGNAFLAVELPSAKKSDHSVLTEQRDEGGVQRVLQFFRDKLVPVA